MSEIVNEVVAEVKKVEGEVVAEAKKVEGEVVAEAKEVVHKVEAAVEKLVQELTVEEKLAIREIENTFLKAQFDLQRVNQTVQKAQKEFTDSIEKFSKKYVINPAEWVFDNVELVFKKVAPKK